MASMVSLVGLIALLATASLVAAAPLNLTINSPKNITYAQSTVELNYSVEGAADWIGFSFDGGGNVTLARNWSIILPVDIAQTATTGIAGFSSETWIAQAFRPNVGNMTAISLLLTALGSGRVNVSIQADNNNQPANLDLVKDSKIISSSGWGVFDLPISLNVSQRYWIVVKGDSSNVKINISGNNPYQGESFAYSVDSGALWTLVSSVDFAFMTHYIMQDGQHFITLYANDSTGNMYSSSISFTVDAQHIPPAISIIDPTPTNNSWKNTNWIYVNATVEDAVSDISSVLVQWDNGTTTNFSLQCTSGNRVICSKNMTNLPDSSYSFKIFANDSAGNGNWSIERFVKLDATPPRFAILSPSNATYAESSIEFNFSVAESNIDWIGYNLDGSANITSSANASFSDLADGSHSIALYANDSAGNTNFTIVRFTIDTKPPIASFAAPTPQNGTWVKTRWVYLNVTAEDATSDMDTVIARWDDEVPVDYQMNCTSGRAIRCGKNFTGLSDGEYRYRIFANDSAGNGNWSLERLVKLDATPPRIAILNPSNATYISSDIEFNVSVTETNVEWLAYSLDGAPNVSLSGNTIITNLTEGTHTIAVYVNDSAGNVNSSIVSFTIDTKPPIMNFTAPTPPNNTWLKTRWVYLNITAEDTTSSVRAAVVRWDEGTPANYPMNCTSGRIIQCWKNITDLPDGPYTYKIFANDSVGNGNWSLERLVKVDATRPSISLSSPENITYNTASIELNFSAIEANRDWVGYSLDGAPNVSLSGNTIITNLTEGTHTIAVYVNDSAGNLGSTVINFAVDTAAPYSVELLLPSDQNLSRDWVLLNWTASDATSELRYLIRLEDAEDGWTLAVRSTNASPYNLTDLTDGKYTVRLFAQDAAGNANSSAKNLTIDRTPPILRSPTASPDPAAPGSNVTLKVIVQDAMSGVQSVEANVTLPNGSIINYNLQFIGGNWSATIMGDNTKQVGSYDVTFRAVDYAGNARTSSTQSFDVKEATSDSGRSIIGGGGGGGGAVDVSEMASGTGGGGSSHFRSDCIKRGMQILNSSFLACAIKEMNLSSKNFYSVPRILAPALALTGDTTGDYPLPEMNASIFGGSIPRLEWDPYEVAAKTALAKWNSTEEVVIARGDIEADAYAATAYAKAMGYPLLLTKPNELPSATQEALGKLRPKTVILVGGPDALLKHVWRELHKYPVVRFWDLGREGTAVDVAWWIKSETHRDVENVIIDDGNEPSVGSAFISALYGIPILYTIDGKVPDATKQFLARHNATDEEGHTLGIVFAGGGVKAMGEVKALLGVG